VVVVVIALKPDPTTDAPGSTLTPTATMLVADLSSYEPLAAPTDDDRARLIVAGLSRLGLAGSTAAETGPGGVPLMDGADGVDGGRSRRSANMTECVTVPSSEHVAEIVGRQGSRCTFIPYN